LFALTGLALNLQPKWTFRQAGTTVDPLAPTRTARLVSTGLYRYTRNPMYLGHVFLLVAWAAWLHNAAALLGVAAYVMYVTRFQIRPEERHLALRFPADFARLRQQSRRWL